MKRLRTLFSLITIVGYTMIYSQTVSVSIVGGNPDNCTGNPVAGTYSLSGAINGRDSYVKGVHTMRWSGSQWEIFESGSPGFQIYYNNANTVQPTCGNWLGTFGCFTIDVTGNCSSPCTDPTVPSVTFSPATVCSGGTATLNISGTLNDATAWQVYTGSCGGTNIGSTTTGTFAIPGTISSPTTYYVRGEGGCITPGSCGSVTITPTALDNAGFSYGASAYCVDAADPTPTITGLAGGTFSSTPAGLSISASTGQIDVSTSTPNTYTVTYTTAGTCPNSSNVSVTINALDNAGFSYGASAYCANGADPTPTITGLAGGTFSSTPAGLSISASTGQIDVSTSTPNTYTVTYTTAGTCPNSSNVSVTINASDDAGFNYSAVEYCSNGSDPTPTITGLVGGTFTSTPAGLSINASTGQIDVSASTSNAYTVTYTTSGTCPNSSTQSVVIDTTSPSAVCQNITVYLDGAGNATITASDIDNGSTDNCGTPSLSINQSAFTCADLGSNSVTLTATDGSLNASTCVATVTVLDSTSPTAVCQNITVYLDGSGNATITASDIDNGSTDNCGTPSLSINQSAFTCADLGSNNVTLTATDGSLNTSTCVATVTVLDSTSPTAVCQNITVYLDGTGNATIVGTDIDGGSTDNCGVTGLSASVSSFDCSNVGTNNVTLTVTDGSLNTSTCVAVVTVADTTNPLVSCQNVTAYLDNLGLATISVFDVDAGSSDNCGIDTMYLSKTNYSCADLGMNTVTLTVVDSNGNIDSCTATVSIMDTLYRGDSLTVVACGSYVFAGDTLTATGWYADTTQILGGCDSITVLDLTINPIPTITISDVNNKVNSFNCYGDSALLVASGGNTYTWSDTRTTDSVYYVFDTAAQFPTIYVVGVDTNLCSDSAFFTSGGVYPAVPVTNVVDSVCDWYVSPSGNYVWTTTGVYNDTLMNVNGCDSIIVTDLTVYYSYADTLTADTICNGDSALIFGSYEQTMGWYVDSLNTNFGCDSLIYKQLVVLPNTTSNVYDSICLGDSIFLGGSYRTQTGLYNDTVGNAPNGCYIIEYHYLTVKSVFPPVRLGPDISECKEATITLFAGDYYDAYLWQDGSTDSALVIDGFIYGEGTHEIMVTVTDNSVGCQDSDTLNITFNNCTDITDVEGGSMINIYPNPTNGLVTVDVSQMNSEDQIVLDVFSVTGRHILTKQVVDNKEQLDLLDQPDGMYIISLKTPRMQLVRRLLIQH